MGGLRWAAGEARSARGLSKLVGDAITASLTPIIAAHFGWNASFSVAAVLCVIGGLAWFWVNPKRTLVPESATQASR